MLTCEEVKNLLSAYYDGELGVAAQQQVAEHLASCESCREELKQLKSLSAAFHTLTFPEADKAFCSSLHERLEAEAKKNRPLGWRTMWKDMRTYATIAACLVLTIGIYAAVSNNSVQPPVTGPVSPPEAGTDLPPSDVEIIPAQPEENTSIVAPTDGATDAGQQPSDVPSAPKIAQGDTGADTNIQQEPQQESAVPEVPSASQTTTSPMPIEPPAETTVPNTEEPKGTVKEVPAATATPDAGITQPGANNTGGGEPDVAATGGDPGAYSVEPNESVTTVASFKLKDAALYDQVVALLGSFGSVTESEGQIEARVLDVNFESCLAALRSLNGLQETGSITTEGDSSGHCYIQIDTKN